jgi:hypothetical protein
LHVRGHPIAVGSLQSSGVGNFTILALEAIAPTNINTIQANAKNRVDDFASLSVFDHTNNGVPISSPTPVIAYTGIISKSIVPRPLADAKATAWIAAIELKIIDAPSELLTSHSVLWNISVIIRRM